ncbi:hypothetical protein L2Y96_12480 [Luteibacter aegosomaticola]|uniref:hypothetical protein n=1 Tax=Luteibacter aegosomaticola TaxID=2911538 RepID=UPI001FF9A2A3|nr:hypothetical protein [Luteibacter aegosomaticola]UPG88236.1 hypothetical protein L2Y96_12480 [Luteibacter aegosomaticola]
MAHARIYIMYPAHNTRTWHVSINGTDGDSYTDGLLALHAACERARVMEEMGDEVTVFQEDAGGAWHVIRE